MKFDSWTKHNKMVHNVLLMAQDAKKQWEKKKIATKGCRHYYIQGFYYVNVQYTGLFSANIIIYSN